MTCSTAAGAAPGRIAHSMLDGSSTMAAANEIVITNGCHGALSIALLSVCKPGTSWR